MKALNEMAERLGASVRFSEAMQPIDFHLALGELTLAAIKNMGTHATLPDRSPIGIVEDVLEEHPIDCTNEDHRREMALAIVDKLAVAGFRMQSRNI